MPPFIAYILALLAVAQPPANLKPNSKDRDRVKAYAPHVRIDWATRRVEVDGEIALRGGMLELFACTPHTREHESIVVSPARPLHIYEALGLVGLSPGHPIKYDAVNARWTPADGDGVRIEVRWEQDEKQHTRDIGQWMRSLKTGKSVPPSVWRFAGSMRDERGEFLADGDGTIICVVDFATALIAYAENKPADNDALWVEAMTENIPPVETRVTLLFSAMRPEVFTFSLGANGKISLKRDGVSMKRLIERLVKFQNEHALIKVVIKVGPQTSELSLKPIRDAILKKVRRGTDVEVLRDESVLDQPIQKRNSDEP